MIEFLHHSAETGRPRWRVFAIALAVLILWTADGVALTPPAGTPIINTATAQYGDANGNPLSATGNTVSAILSGAPKLHVEKTADVNPVKPGAAVTYTLLYENTGNAQATGVTVVDTLPANVIFQSASAGGVYNPADRTVTWTVGTLAAGTGGFLRITVQVQSNLVYGASIVNAVSVTCAEGTTDAETLAITVGSGSNLVLEKSGAPSTVAPNGTITYTLSYRNIGNQTAHTVHVTDSIPASTVFVTGSATAPGIVNGGVLNWDIGDIAAGTRGELTFQVSVSPLAVSGQQIANQASIVSSEQVITSNTVMTVVSSTSLMLLKMDSPDPVRAGNNITYTLQISNTGTTPLTGVILRDPLPVGTIFVSADSGGIPDTGNRQVTWNIGNLAVGETRTVTLTVQTEKTLSQGQILENIATATSDEMEPQTVRAVSSVNARTTGNVEFFDAAWQPVIGYASGNIIYVQVIDPDQNTDPTTVQTVTVVLTSSATGDTETVTLTETGPNTGIFRGSVPSSLNVSAVNDGTLTVAANSRIQATYTDALDDSPVHNASALIDPQGTVFDSITGNPLAGAVVTLRNWNNLTNACDLSSLPALPPGQVNPAAATGADGRFTFPLVYPGDYCFDVTPPQGYTFPSAVADASLPAGYTIGNGSRGEKFSLSASDLMLIRDIPLDPPTGRLVITKTANKTTASIGEMIVYTIKLENKGEAPVSTIAISDIMPHGITYISGSSLTGDVKTADPGISGNRTFVWTVSDLAVNGSVTISYRALVGPDAQAGNGTNTVTASGISLGRTIASNRSSVKIKITEGVFTSKGTIIGRVFFDRNGDGLAGKDTGIPDVALYLEDGTRVITDNRGKFSISGVVAGTHVLRLDETSLPQGCVPKPLSNRFMKSGSSQFIDMTPGGLFKANFAVDKKVSVPVAQEESEMLKNNKFLMAENAGDDASGMPPAVALKENWVNIKEEKRSLDTATGVQAGAEGDSAAAKETLTLKEQSLAKGLTELQLEEKIKTMTPDLEFLSPAAQAVLGKNSIRVIIKAPMDHLLTLTVNGRPVDESHIGAKIKYEKGKVIIYEFVDVRLLTGEENIIAAELRDQFDIIRGEKQIKVETIGEPVRLVIVPDRKTAQADGKSRIQVAVSLEDRKGRPVPSGAPITVEVTAGEILEKDADPANEGHQIMCPDGTAHFSIIAPRETGDAKINVKINDLTQSTNIYFAPDLRPMFVVGIGEVVLGHGRSSGDISYLKDRSAFGDGTYLDGRGAFFMKGNIYKDVLLTAAYDSGKKRTDELFRESDTRLDSEEKYPIYGDESKTGYEALSRENLYVKLEKDKSYLLYGDYRTDLTEAKLSAYSRSFNGLKLEVNTDQFKLRSFGTHTDQSQFIDTVPGKGISGYYYLTHQQIIDGSERVTVETRDRLQPDRILSRELKTRGSDYEIDYDMGTLLFKAAIPSHDAEGNPLYIVASYEGMGDGTKYFIYGGRGAYKVANWLEVGATGVVEENGISDYHLFGTDIKMNLPGSTTLKAEYARTRGLFDIGSLLTSEQGEGWSLDVEGRPMQNLSVKGYYRDLSDFFSNPSATDAVRGTTKYGLEAAYEIQPTWTARAKYLDEKDRINNSSHLLASVGTTKKFTKTTVSAEIAHEEADNLTETPAQVPYTPGGLLNGVPFLNPYETPKRATFLKLALERELLSNLSLSLSHKQDVGGSDYFISQGGLNYKLNDQSRLYVREEYAKYDDGTQNRLLLGVESQILKNTTLYNEYRLADGSAGYRNQQVMGLKNKFQMMDGVTASIAGEYLSTLSGEKNKNEPDAYAVSTGFEYLPKDDFKLTGRLEHRNEIGGEKSSYLAEVAAAYKIHPDYSLLLRERYFLEKNGADENQTSRMLVGLAYRPLDNDRLNALSKIEYKYNRQSAYQPGCATNDLIISTEGVYQANRDLQLMGKYAGKLEQDDSYTSYTDLISARILYDLSDRFDLGAEYRLLTSHLTGTSLHGGSLEVGYRIMEQLWLSVGYSFDRFDADLAGDSYQGEGPYMRLRFKFDENTLKTARQ